MESRLPDLLSDSPRQRLQTALEMLSELAEAEATPLATQITVRPEASNDSEQLTRVLDLLHKRFAEPIRVEDLCSVGNLSPRSLHRLFVRHVGENLSDYLGRLRIGRACMLLVETDRPISVIASEAGFANLSNFNRRFREARRMTPKDFRRFVVKHGPDAGLTTEGRPEQAVSVVGNADEAAELRGSFLRKDQGPRSYPQPERAGGLER